MRKMVGTRFHRVISSILPSSLIVLFQFVGVNAIYNPALTVHDAISPNDVCQTTTLTQMSIADSHHHYRSIDRWWHRQQ